MFYVDETLVGGCSCEAKLNISRIDQGSKIGGQEKYAFGVGEMFASFAMFFCDRAISHRRSPPGGLARIGSVWLGSASQSRRLLWARRHLFKTCSFWRRRDDT